MTDFPEYLTTIEAINRRSTDAILSHSRIASRSANEALRRRLAHGSAKEGFVADPVFEAQKVWKAGELTMKEVAEAGILLPEFVDALATAEQNDVPLDRKPYEHQLTAWKTAAAGHRSYMVTSGTGSGKTECFMVPMINDLLKQAQGGQSLKGVHAITLYPLNALIESQRERLSAWVAPFKKQLSYALYNGDMVEEPNPRHRPLPGQINNRKDLRAKVPPILLTNVTMLEYLLLRPQDRPILEASKGKLKWIVLDEAHSYVGAQAAEMALMLRRVREAFGVKPEEVRLVATSATIGEGEETRNQLRRYLADLAGVSEDLVDVIEGSEIKPVLPSPKGTEAYDPKQLVSLDEGALYNRLSPDKTVQKLVKGLQEGGKTLTQVADIARLEKDLPDRPARAFELLSTVAKAKDPVSGLRLLPWRMHAFHRAQGGLWVCCDPDCNARAPELTLEGNDWPWGQIHLFQRDHCDCGAAVFELMACHDCGTSHLVAEEILGASFRLRQPVRAEVDDYAPDQEEVEADETEIEAAGNVVVLSPVDQGGTTQWMDKKTSVVSDSSTGSDGMIKVAVRDIKPSPCCGARNGPSRIRYGAPFLLGNALPLLLESLPAPEGGADKPFGGRRALSFTDSRQGTARMAAKLQQEAERSLTRATVWHAVQNAGQGGDPEEIARQQETVAKLEAFGDAMPADVLAGEREKLDNLVGGVGRVKWSEMVSLLASNPQISHIQPAWKNRGEGGHILAEDPVRMAEMLLLREFFRRPKKQNNAETMGLAKLAWPTLEQKLKSGSIPEVISAAKLTLDDWIALHEVAIDTAFRATFAVKADRHPVNLPHWISPREKSKTLFGPETRQSEVAGKRPVRWPSAKRSERSVIVRIVGRLIDADPKTDGGQSRIDDLLLKIWQNLRTSKVIKNTSDTRWVIDLECAEFQAVQIAGICPSTRRILSSHPGGISPTALDSQKVEQWIELPKLIVAKPGGLSSEERNRVKIWCQTDPIVKKLRSLGQWGNLHDAVADFTPVLRAQEHSAQIDRPSLKTYEDEFRDGNLNLLNCSTTMEMGVDLAEIETVINTNVPPSPANYRQRIGRAGRRGEPWAMAFTFCRDLPLDRRVWNNPSELLEANIAAPKVKLDSRVILQRHVNAFFLGRFLADNGGLRLGTGVGDFLGAKAVSEVDAPFIDNSVADRFIDALRSEWARSERVLEGLKSLLTGTPLSGEVEGLAEATCDAFLSLRNSWSDEYLALVRSHSVAEALNSSAESRFFRAQAHRMRKEFLLAELARRGFTPSYGFPIDVVGFSYIGKTPSENVREEGTRFASGPSRSLDIALRDYAPGSEVVVDGLVYRADGILPSWASQADPGKVEDLRDMWICRSCGEHGLDTAWREVCPKCEAPLEAGRRRRVLKPSGFLSKDSAPHTAYEQLNWVAPERPRLSASDAEWQSLSDPGLGRLRSSRTGRILQRSSGPWSEGFAICLACGRADAETDPGGLIEGETYELPAGMKNHSPLVRTDRARRDDGKCIGLEPTSRAIQRNVQLGYETHSDIFEIQLFPLEKADNSVAWALGSAIREALSKTLGIQAHDEMGVAVQSAVFEDGVHGPSILLFDRAPGGAGFSTLAGSPGMIDQLLKDAARILDCDKCSDGCPDCVLRPDLQHDGTPLDRSGALEILEKKVLFRLELPKHLRVFGEKTTALHRGAVQWLLSKSRGSAPEAITLFLHGKCETLDLSEWRAVSALKQLPSTCKISIAVPDALLGTMEQSHKRDLLRVLARLDAKLVRVPVAPSFGDIPQIIEETSAGVTAAMGASGKAAALVGEDWGKASGGPILTGLLEARTETTPISMDKLMDFGEANAIVHEFHSELDGRIEDFGKRFWAKVRSLRPQAFADGSTVQKIGYSDRYLKSPLSMALAISVISNTPTIAKETKKSISTTRIDYNGQGRFIWDNWPDSRSRDQVVREIDPGIQLFAGTQKDCPHERRLVIKMSGGSSLVIRLDQGFGAWVADRTNSSFSFDFSPPRQAISMMSSGVKVGLRDTATGTPISIVWKG